MPSTAVRHIACPIWGTSQSCSFVTRNTSNQRSYFDRLTTRSSRGSAFASLRRLCETVGSRIKRSFVPGRYAEFSKDIGHMTLDRREADEQGVGNLLDSTRPLLRGGAPRFLVASGQCHKNRCCPMTGYHARWRGISPISASVTGTANVHCPTPSVSLLFARLAMSGSAHRRWTAFSTSH